ncbi:hypothetical protein MPF19_08565 [Polaribacter sp. Z014]|uniref:hypothetical protein n=1 Tax=unclassified Polaribacter TaxID=196858 RepID=UPI00193BD49B|nr:MULTISPECIES: hypothetical protein [unclassified Polaribacter]MCL7763463.1 hypothetical protein [Polaribacter sp. Z014]QVY66759.1 hypothetical protein JOP69_05610 [Polaribacter sp. Q13]
MKIKNVLIVSLVFLVFTKLNAQEANLSKEKSWYVPDYVKMQFGGNIGLVSVGAGYQLFNKVLYSELLYGYVPSSVSKADRIHLITIKNTFPIFRKEIGKNLTITPIAGFTTTYDIGTMSFTTLPGIYPEGYYVPNAFHFTLYGGGLIHKDFKKSKIIKGLDFYIEIGTVETYLWYTITSKDVGVNDVFSADVGVNFYF